MESLPRRHQGSPDFNYTKSEFLNYKRFYSSFNTIWGSSYVGMNYGPKSLRSVDIRCSNSSYNDYYATMVHEMAHSWDFFYASKFGSNISSQNDVINLYEKYQKSKNKPFREYI